MPDRIKLVFGLLACTLFMTAPRAQMLDLPGAIEDPAVLSAAMPTLARAVMAMFRNDDRRAYLDTLDVDYMATIDDPADQKLFDAYRAAERAYRKVQDDVLTDGLKPKTFTLDGEVAVFDQGLISRFEWLRGRPKDEPATLPVYIAFDILELAVTAAPGSWGGQRLSLVP